MNRFSFRHLPWHTTFLLGFASALTAIALGVWLAMFFLRRDTVTQFALVGNSASPVSVSEPWGRLEAQRIPLVNADDIDLAANQLMGPPRWFFGCTQDQLVRYLMSADLRARERGLLLDQRHWKIHTNGCEIAPPEAVVLTLDPASRARIYSVLAKSEFNPAQKSPYRFAPGRFKEHLQAIGLEGFEISRLERLTYTNSSAICLADLGIAKKLIREHSFEEFLEMIYSTPAYTVRLRVMPDSDIHTLAAYWGRGGREKQITPLLRSLANVPGGGSISIIALLPEFARNRVYTFPTTWDDATANRQDCAYTAMNFFNQVVNTNFLNPETIQQTLVRDYLPANDQPTFGDLVQLVDGEGRIFHMSVFLADDFVFTKNGVSLTEPWTIMRLKDMLTLYFANRTEGRVLVLRRKEFTNVPPDTAPAVIPSNPSQLALLPTR